MKWKDYKEDPPRNNDKAIIFIVSTGIPYFVDKGHYVNDSDILFWSYVNIPSMGYLKRKIKNKQKCHGCTDDFYNEKETGGCWNYKPGKMIKRVRVSVEEYPPYNREPEYCMDCYRKKGYAFFNR